MFFDICQYSAGSRERGAGWVEAVDKEDAEETEELGIVALARIANAH